MEFMSQLGVLDGSDRLTEENIAYLQAQFRKHAGEGNEISKAEFHKIIKTKNQFFTDRVFDIFDTDKSGSISLDEYVQAVQKLAGNEAEDKIQFLFKVYDADGNGVIQESELEQVMRANMEENGMEFSQEQIHALTSSLFCDADVDQGGTLTYEELKGQLAKYPGLLENLASSIERWLVPEKPKEKPKLPILVALKSKIPHQLSWHYVKNNYSFLGWLSVILLITVALFAVRVVSFHRDNQNATTWQVIARGCGRSLNFVCALIAVTMLRKTLTFLRSHGGADYFPIDQSIFFHQFCGWLIFILGLVHTVAHLVNIEVGFRKNPQINPEGFSYIEYLFAPHATPKLGLIPGYAFNSGVILYLMISAMVVCSQPFIRRGGHFQVFYWTHLMYFGVWALLIIHAPNFWKWFLLPGVIFLFEKLYGLYCRRVGGTGKSYIKAGIILPSKVTHLVINRPPGFTYHPGDYVFVKIPQIAKFEYHPFTISSSPEQKDEIWLHIRAVGEWTDQLYKYFRNERNYQTVFSQKDAQIEIAPVEESEDSLKPKDDSVSTNVSSIEESFVAVEHKRSLKIFIDGPHGAPSSHIFRAEHAVLIGTGIGITPFASILQSIMRRYWMSRNTCPSCGHQWAGELPESVLSLKKVDFFWINREQKCFEWFVQMLAELEMEQAEKGGVMDRFLDMHMYITSALKKTDMKAVGLQLAMDLLYKKEKRDLITGLKVRTKAGRPDFKEVSQKPQLKRLKDKVEIFKNLRSQNKGKVTVFFCGAPQMAKSLKVLCDDFGFTFRKECF